MKILTNKHQNEYARQLPMRTKCEPRPNIFPAKTIKGQFRLFFSVTERVHGHDISRDSRWRRSASSSKLPSWPSWKHQHQIQSGRSLSISMEKKERKDATRFSGLKAGLKLRQAEKTQRIIEEGKSNSQSLRWALLWHRASR